MYSVIIQNQKTMEAFSQHQFLFSEAISSGEIGVCKWIESGINIETAVPELGNMTDEKEEWRAIIVRYIDDDCMSNFETSPSNPYDFLINKENEEKIEESPIPLIRLAQMLGGVPPPEIKFESKTVREEHKAPRTVYVPVEYGQEEQNYERLVNKYKYDGKLPSSVVIISIRENKQLEGNTDISRHAFKESDSSSFWKRNRFPSICRFLVYDFIKQGPIQRNADDFSFWYSVMMMATNDWDSSTIQAYRLYSLKIEIDRDEMAESFQMLVNRLRDAKCSINKSIKRDIENQICREEELPKYRIDISVALRLPKTKDRSVRKKSFPLLSDGSTTDVATWTKQRKDAEEELANAVRTAERALDQTADKMRGSCSLDENEVLPLNKYQEEDLSREINKTYHRIIDIQGKLPKENISADEKVQKVASAVKESLRRRVMKKPVILSMTIVVVLMFLTSIPAIVDYISQKNGSILMTILILLVSLLFAAIGGALVLVIQKRKLDALIETYNQQIRNAFNKLVGNASDYSRYMSGIANHARGSSLLNFSKRKQHCSNEKHYTKYMHIRAITILLGKLKAWSKAFHLNVDFTSKRPDMRLDVDTTVPPIENKMYTFEAGAKYPVNVNNSGMSVDAPHRFIKRIIIAREELYKDE